ncbi:MAG: permease-like cell division protein FtsX [Clostridia bacterium]|nr:permease-like cell division protein FtsX [Clostridia bacterium]
MKIRTTSYIIKEGLVNSYRNKLMSLASIVIVAASLFIFGIFVVITINLGQLTKDLEEQPQLRVICQYDLDDSQVQLIEDSIRQNGKIDQFTRISKQDAFNKVKEMFAENAGLLEGLDESFLPVKFHIKLKNGSEGAAVSEELKKIEGVKKVDYPKEIFESISRLSYWVRMASITLIAILLIIAMFIISNTIKLTVFARRKEISIMKYIGATDWFIRWPFIIEGVIIGMLGALVAFGSLGLLFKALMEVFARDLVSLSFGQLKLIGVSDIWGQLISLCMLIGCSVGAIGSVISIRKYLNV